MSATAQPDPTQSPSCDYCGSAAVEWVKCKLICRNCRQIVKSCADLAEPIAPG